MESRVLMMPNHLTKYITRGPKFSWTFLVGAIYIFAMPNVLFFFLLLVKSEAIRKKKVPVIITEYNPQLTRKFLDKQKKPKMK